MSSAIPGGLVPDLNMILQSEGGEDFVLEGKFIPLVPLKEILAYLTHLYEDGMQYNTIAFTKSALANGTVSARDTLLF